MDKEYSAVSVILPSYKPDDNLLRCVDGLIDAGFTDIIVVDDGGGAQYSKYFDKVREHSQCTVLTHEENRGKGAALKTALKWYLKNRDGAGVITVDGDGQHRPEDIISCASRLISEDCVILGCRDFSSKDVPARSSFGNKVSCFVFKTFVGMKISDTQTGLRAIPERFIEELSKVKGERYEYETNMLLYMQRHEIPYAEEKIETIYVDDNKTSHFRPIKDSMRIYSLIFRHLVTSQFFLFLCNSIVCYWSDILMFIILDSILSPISSFAAIAGGVLLAITTYGIPRLISSLLNFCLNRLIFKRQGGSVLKTMIKYYLLVAFNLAVGSITVYLITMLLLNFDSVVAFCTAFPGDSPSTVLKSMVKIVVDALLYICSYNVQKHLIFKKEK